MDFLVQFKYVFTTIHNYGLDEGTSINIYKKKIDNNFDKSGIVNNIDSLMPA